MNRKRFGLMLVLAAFFAAMLAGPGAAVFPSTFRWAAWIACPAGSTPQPRTWPGVEPGGRRAGFWCVTPDGQEHERTLQAAGGLWLMYFMGLSVAFSLVTLRAGASPAPAAALSARRGLPADLDSAVRALVARDQLIHAIKLVRDRPGMGLKEAKDYVEAIRSGAAPASPSSSSTASPPNAVPTSAAAAGGMTPELVASVRELVSRDQVIHAVKLVREQTGVGLAEAKALVEAIQVGRFAMPAAPAAGSPTERMEELKRMLDAGLITQAEFETKKAEILASL